MQWVWCMDLLHRSLLGFSELRAGMRAIELVRLRKVNTRSWMAAQFLWMQLVFVRGIS